MAANGSLPFKECFLKMASEHVRKIRTNRTVQVVCGWCKFNQQLIDVTHFSVKFLVNFRQHNKRSEPYDRWIVIFSAYVRKKFFKAHFLHYPFNPVNNFNEFIQKLISGVKWTPNLVSVNENEPTQIYANFYGNYYIITIIMKIVFDRKHVKANKVHCGLRL